MTSCFWAQAPAVITRRSSVGPESGLRRSSAFAEDIALTCHPHPTRSEALRQAAMNVEGMATQM